MPNMAMTCPNMFSYDFLMIFFLLFYFRLFHKVVVPPEISKTCSRSILVYAKNIVELPQTPNNLIPNRRCLRRVIVAPRSTPPINLRVLFEHLHLPKAWQVEFKARMIAMTFAVNSTFLGHVC